MTEVLVKIAFGLATVFLAVYYSVQYISRKQAEIDQEQDTTPELTKEELENIKLAEELYNKDLRPIVAKKEKTVKVPEGIYQEPGKEETKSELPSDRPKKKRKYYPKKKK